jgi:hypothetical protein
MRARACEWCTYLWNTGTFIFYLLISKISLFLKLFHPVALVWNIRNAPVVIGGKLRLFGASNKIGAVYG